MKFATCIHEGREKAVVVQEDAVHPLEITMRELVDGGLGKALELGAEALRKPGFSLDDVALCAPLQPSTMRDFVAFEEHVEGVRRSMDGGSGVVDAWYEAPRFYFTNPYTVSGPNAVIRPPAACKTLDFEMEVAAVVSKSGSSLSVEEARDHIFGYTILNDWSARDIQRREMQVSLGPAKGKDFANTLGPWIVTADEFDDYRDGDGFLDVSCTVTVNGEEVGRDSLANMGWTFESLVAYASRDSWVHSGDVLGSGTTGNGGCLAELWGRRGEQSPPPLRVGDVVTITVEGIGSLTNTVGDGRPSPEVPPARRVDHAAIRNSRKALS
ncbi:MULTISPECIES: fumarylacetoacetate hydrolase family protein [Rhodococcus]|uniref:Hydroxylase n=1 Tax=Rhodococcus qingshengii TaxID=334542 RepID=A0A2A5JA92_RHOSG|nr:MULTISPECIES: fumarylacetoacetate hydrolase family protein [Rhodococcus]MDJ0105161.1 fumarylacetoacetate hydrolase family protein [Rhodococcus erythropolis]MDV8013891.1 fumarylacetoacetate hydrolase family protein [Rhodococcus sp. IEGM 1241]PCK26475.1 hydroxylase [Rhodococcus qingshengii]